LYFQVGKELVVDVSRTSMSIANYDGIPLSIFFHVSDLIGNYINASVHLETYLFRLRWINKLLKIFNSRFELLQHRL
jgi:hypothetical protein